MLLSRESLELRERDQLALYAVKSGESLGRIHKDEKEHPLRTCFMRDRDRIIHSQSFRRLEYKTQVFVYSEGDHYRNRLTHTIEVSQISRTIGRILKLNEDLIEAIALAHDIGHPPFGHAGEKILDKLLKLKAESSTEEFLQGISRDDPDGKFNHNFQALRILTKIESRSNGERGLNLTLDALEGIDKKKRGYLDLLVDVKMPQFKRSSLEGQVVDIADSIAYNAHDLDDGLLSGIISFDQLEDLSIFSFSRESYEKLKSLDTKRKRIFIVRELVNNQVTDLLNQTSYNLETGKYKHVEDIRSVDFDIVSFSDTMRSAHRELKKFLMERFYKSQRMIRMELKAAKIIESLFNVYCERDDLLPEQITDKFKIDGKLRIISDYIAGMTDKYAIEEYDKLFNPFTKV